MSPPPPLPRSLIPLPGESQPGLLLRLSYRLNHAPGEIARHTGLAAKTAHIPGRHLLMLEPPDLAAFSTATRLSMGQIDQLTLRPLAHRYPPIRDALTRPRSSAQRPRGFFSAWMLGASSRYCPECLCGDGSEIQNRYGGPWRLSWRLAVVFACTRHNVFLRYLCPSCQQPAHRGSSTKQRRLIPSSTIGGLHPAQCRNPASRTGGGLCGAWLNESTTADGHELTPQLLNLQKRILRLLDPADLTEAPSTVFSDLQVISALVTATWPAAASVTPERELATAFTRDVKQHHTPDSAELGRHWTGIPSSPIAAACLLDVSTRLLNLPGRALPQALALLFDRTTPSSSGWGRTWTTLRHHCSPQLRQYVNETMPSQLVGRPARADLRRGRRPLIATEAARRYLPDHIPQRIPDDWFAAMIGEVPPTDLSPSVYLRRFAAVQLVQIAANVEWGEAARFLGIPDAWHRASFGSKSHSRLHTFPHRDRPEVLDPAMARIVNHVSALRNHSDYRARRRHFADWTLSPSSWPEFVDLIAQHGPAPLFRTDDVLRETASVFVWVLLTGSEWNLAPNAWTQLVDRPPQWKTHSMLLRKITYRVSPRFSALHNALAAHAELLLGRPPAESRRPT